MSIEEKARELVAMWLASQEMATFSEWVPAAATMKLIGDVAAALREAREEDIVGKIAAWLSDMSSKMDAASPPGLPHVTGRERDAMIVEMIAAALERGDWKV